MSDPVISTWPVTWERRVVKAEPQTVDAGQAVYRIEFLDSSGRKLLVQLSEPLLRSLAESVVRLLDPPR